MTMLALEALAADPATEVIVIISKPPAPSVLPTLDAAIRAGEEAGDRLLPRASRTRHRRAAGIWVATLEDAAEAAVAAARGTPWQPRAFSDPRARARARSRRRRPPRAALLALYTGGTLAHEARLVLEPLLGPIAGNVGAAAREPAPHPGSRRRRVHARAARIR